MTLLIVGLVLLAIVFLGIYGLPENVNPAEYQSDPEAGNIMKGAEPFRLEGTSDTAFLMVHGFEGSPFTLKGLGEVLHKHGHTVIAPLLPGHGTTPKNFSKTRYQHWYRKVQKIYKEERPKYKSFFILGFSMGGNLSLRLTIQYSRSLPPSGLILLSTPVALNGILNGKVLFKDPRLVFSGIVKHLMPFIRKNETLAAAEVISPWVGYSDYYATACVHSFKRNLGKVRPHLHRISCPTCLIQATNDNTIAAENLHYILRKISSFEKRSFLFTIDENLSTRHVLITHEHIKEKVFHYILEFVQDSLAKFDLHPAHPQKRRSLFARWFKKPIA